MTKDEFKEAISALQDFFQEQEKLQAVLNAISPTSTGVVEFGGFLIVQYLKVLEIALKSRNGYVSDFVFESQFGKYPMTGSIDGKDFSITTAEELYDLIVK